MTDEPKLYIGTYTEDTGSDGIYCFSDGQLQLAAPCTNPSYLVKHPDFEVIYSVSEVKRFEESASGAVTALYMHEDNQLSIMNQQASMGADPCHLAIAPDGQFLVVSNYSGGTFATFAIDSEGHIDNFLSLTEHKGSSVHPERQTQAHVHSSLLIKNQIFIADLGADQIARYLISAEGQIDASSVESFQTNAGAGPRMMIQDGHQLIVINELNNSLSFHNLTTLESEYSIPSLSNSASVSIAAHICLSNDNQYLYVSNRGENTITVFARASNQRFELIQAIDCGGDHPRFFALTSDEAGLWVANQHSNQITEFKRDPATGRLSSTGFHLDVPAPACLLWV